MTALMSYEEFFKYLNIDRDDFQELLEILKDDIKKMRNDFPDVSEINRLGIALRYLTSGDSSDTIAKHFGMQTEIARKIIKRVCKAVCKRLTMPTVTQEMLCRSARGFEDAQLFPHCVGVLCGKHVLVNFPSKDPKYVNYAGEFAVTLLFLADSRHCLLAAEVQPPNSKSDDVILEDLKSGNVLLLHSSMPEPKFEDGIVLPSVMVADQTFPLGEHLITPYPKEVTQMCKSRKQYNDRLFKVLDVAESTLGLMVQRFQILKKPLNVGGNQGMVFLSAVCCLYNFFRIRDIGRTGGKFHKEVAQEAVNQSTAFMKMIHFGVAASLTAQGVRDNFIEHFVKEARYSS